MTERRYGGYTAAELRERAERVRLAAEICEATPAGTETRRVEFARWEATQAVNIVALCRAYLDLLSSQQEGKDSALDDVPSAVLERAITLILQDVCELPDRTSPDDQPEMMLVTGTELDMLLRRHLGLEDRALTRATTP